MGPLPTQAFFQIINNVTLVRPMQFAFVALLLVNVS